MIFQLIWIYNVQYSCFSLALTVLEHQLFNKNLGRYGPREWFGLKQLLVFFTRSWFIKSVSYKIGHYLGLLLVELTTNFFHLLATKIRKHGWYKLVCFPYLSKICYWFHLFGISVNAISRKYFRHQEPGNIIRDCIFEYFSVTCPFGTNLVAPRLLSILRITMNFKQCYSFS